MRGRDLDPVPGHDDGWSLVTFTTRFRSPFARTSAESPQTPGDETPTATDGQVTATKGLRSGRRLVPLVAAATVILVGGATAGYAHANKAVTLDVDGEVVRVTTFAGSVDGLLAEHGVQLGERDVVTPSGALTEGTDVVVRHARQVTVSLDGTEKPVWTTAITADEALDTLASRASDVALVASRSAAGGRPELALDLTLHGSADVLVDGQTLQTPDGDARVAQVLGELGITLNPLDRVSVRQSPEGRVQVVVNRVAVQEVASTHAVPFASSTQEDASLYTGQRKVAVAGVAGVRTLVERVTTVDGVETARETVSDQITQAPVDELVKTGTKARPAPAPKATSSGSTAAAGPITAGGSADSLNWAALAKCESGGNPSAVSSTGKYHGLYQFSVATWQAVGGAGLPSQASPDEQTARAKMLYNRSGAGQWPHCGKYLFS
ncbi:DUF348 domain-containing protein [Cellulomonas septica]|uniref:DUF348 domain-containing protein n=1 Tax=Cellulomonas septica TaxID=285080 RepID=A0ABX1JXU4_9CELL|nr:DUF348 domain-containing protein [Cellulomonas septica]